MPHQEEASVFRNKKQGEEEEEEKLHLEQFSCNYSETLIRNSFQL